MSTSPCYAGSDSITGDQDLFRSLSKAYAAFAKKAGVETAPYRDPRLNLFSRKGAEERKQILHSLDICVRICERAETQGHAMSNSVGLIWSAVKEFGFRPPSDLFSHISAESVVEIHSPNGVQIFRNFNFYRYCSYSIEELYCGLWHSLYERDRDVVADIAGALRSIFSGEIKHTLRLDIAPHLVKEVFSALRYEVEVQMHFLAALADDESGKPAASIVVESATLLRAHARPDTQPLRPVPSLQPG